MQLLMLLMLLLVVGYRKEAEIAPLLDVEDMVRMKNPDWKCVFTYVQSFYRRFEMQPKQTTATQQQPQQQQEEKAEEKQEEKQEETTAEPAASDDAVAKTE